jgi:hypothetical protein
LEIKRVPSKSFSFSIEVISSEALTTEQGQVFYQTVNETIASNEQQIKRTIDSKYNVTLNISVISPPVRADLLTTTIKFTTLYQTLTNASTSSPGKLLENILLASILWFIKIVLH